MFIVYLQIHVLDTILYILYLYITTEIEYFLDIVLIKFLCVVLGTIKCVHIKSETHQERVNVVEFLLKFFNNDISPYLQS